MHAEVQLELTFVESLEYIRGVGELKGKVERDGWGVGETVRGCGGVRV